MKAVKAYILEPATVNVANMPSDGVPVGILATPAGITMYVLQPTGLAIAVDRKFLVTPSDRAIPEEWDLRYIGSTVADGIDPIHVFEITKGLILG